MRADPRRPHYEPISARAVPDGLRWDVPAQNQGQIVEVGYADERPNMSFAGWAPDERTASPYRRTHDRSDGRTVYARMLGDIERRVLSAVAEGVRSERDIAHHVGEVRKDVRTAAHRLRRDGILRATWDPGGGGPAYCVVPANYR